MLAAGDRFLRAGAAVSLRRPAPSAPEPAGSTAGRWCRRCSPRARCPGCCRRLRWTASTTSTATWGDLGLVVMWAPAPHTAGWFVC